MNERRTFPCPSCSVVLPAGIETPRTCPHCGLLLHGPIAAELESIDIELTRLGRRSSELIGRRSGLLAQLRPAPVGVPAPAGWQPAGWTARRPPTRPTGVPVQTTLLTLGALLLSVAGTIFTALTWGHLGIAGRGVVLALGTVLAVGASALLLHRGLRASGDAVAVLALVLGALDLHAVRLLVAADADALGWWSGATALLATVGVAAGARLRLPALLTVAAGVGQVVLPLAALAALVAAPSSSDLRGALAVLAVALAGTAVLDVGARHVAGTAGATAATEWMRPVLRALQVAAGAILALAGALASGAGLAVDDAAQAVPGAAALLVVAGGWSLLTVQTQSRLVVDRANATSIAAATFAGAASASVLLAGTALLLPIVADSKGADLEAGLLVPTSAATLLLLVAPRLSRRIRTGPLLVGSGVVGAALLVALNSVLATGAGVAAQLGRPWPETLPASTADVLHAGRLAPPHVTLVALLGLAALAAVLARRGLPVEAERLAGAIGAALASAALIVLPAAVAVPLPVAVAAMLALTAGLVVPVLLGRDDASAPSDTRLRGAALLVLATPFALSALAWAATGRVLTLLTLAVLAALPGAIAYRRGDARGPIATTTGTAATMLGLALAPVAGLALNAPVPTAGALLVAAGAATILGVDRPLPGPIRTGILGASGAALALGTALAAGSPDVLCVVLAGLAVAALALTLRPGREPAVVAAGGLATAALWVRLADTAVTLPEAYTLPPALLALAIGEAVRRRRPDLDPSLSLTPGLLLALVPTLLITLGQDDPLRTALLTAGAATVVLAGAAGRLRAPLVLGGLVLGAVALRQLAPLAAVTPRWVLLGGLGLVLLTLGIRYERARADLGRLRRSFARLD